MQFFTALFTKAEVGCQDQIGRTAGIVRDYGELGKRTFRNCCDFKRFYNGMRGRGYCQPVCEQLYGFCCTGTGDMNAVPAITDLSGDTGFTGYPEYKRPESDALYQSFDMQLTAWHDLGLYRFR